MMTPELVENIDKSSADFFIYLLHLNSIHTISHKHNRDQLLYTEGGIIHIFTEGKHWYLPARCFMWIPAGIEHSILTYSKKVDLLNIYFKKEAVDNQAFFQETNIYFANDLLREMLLYLQDWDGEILPDVPYKYYFLKALKENLPEMQSTKLPLTIQHPFPKDHKLVEVATFLYKNIAEEHTLEEIAKRFGMSTRTISRKFKEDVGMNYVRFLRSLRITKAIELIAQHHYNMYEIAMMVGYNSLSTFSNIFYKVAGMRPSEYAHILYAKSAANAT